MVIKQENNETRTKGFMSKIGMAVVMSRVDADELENLYDQKEAKEELKNSKDNVMSSLGSILR